MARRDQFDKANKAVDEGEEQPVKPNKKPRKQRAPKADSGKKARGGGKGRGKGRGKGPGKGCGKVGRGRGGRGQAKATARGGRGRGVGKGKGRGRGNNKVDPALLQEEPFVTPEKKSSNPREEPQTGSKASEPGKGKRKQPTCDASAHPKKCPKVDEAAPETDPPASPASKPKPAANPKKPSAKPRPKKPSAKPHPKKPAKPTQKKVKEPNSSGETREKSFARRWRPSPKQAAAEWEVLRDVFDGFIRPNVGAASKLED